MMAVSKLSLFLFAGIFLASVFWSVEGLSYRNSYKRQNKQTKRELVENVLEKLYKRAMGSKKRSGDDADVGSGAYYTTTENYITADYTTMGSRKRYAGAEALELEIPAASMKTPSSGESSKKISCRVGTTMSMNPELGTSSENAGSMQSGCDYCKLTKSSSANPLNGATFTATSWTCEQFNEFDGSNGKCFKSLSMFENNENTFMFCSCCEDECNDGQSCKNVGSSCSL